LYDEKAKLVPSIDQKRFGPASASSKIWTFVLLVGASLKEIGYRAPEDTYLTQTELMTLPLCRATSVLHGDSDG